MPRMQSESGLRGKQAIPSSKGDQPRFEAFAARCGALWDGSGEGERCCRTDEENRPVLVSVLEIEAGGAEDDRYRPPPCRARAPIAPLLILQVFETLLQLLCHLRHGGVFHLL